MDGSFGSALYPERELWFAQSFFKFVSHDLHGTWMDMSNIVQDRGSLVIIAPPALAANATFTFETAEGDPAQNYCAPLTGSITALMQGGLCDTPAALSVLVDKDAAAYSATLGQIIRVPIQTRLQFIRAIISVETVGFSVLAVGKARNLFSV